MAFWPGQEKLFESNVIELLISYLDCIEMSSVLLLIEIV